MRALRAVLLAAAGEAACGSRLEAWVMQADPATLDAAGVLKDPMG